MAATRGLAEAVINMKKTALTATLALLTSITCLAQSPEIAYRGLHLGMIAAEAIPTAFTEFPSSRLSETGKQFGFVEIILTKQENCDQMPVDCLAASVLLSGSNSESGKVIRIQAKQSFAEKVSLTVIRDKLIATYGAPRLTKAMTDGSMSFVWGGSGTLDETQSNSVNESMFMTGKYAYADLTASLNDSSVLVAYQLRLVDSEGVRANGRAMNRQLIDKLKNVLRSEDSVKF